MSASYILAALLIAGDLSAETQVDARLDTTRMHIGDPLTLTLTVRTDKAETVRFPDLSSALGDFELLSSLPPERYDEDQGAALERRSYKLTTFNTGTQALPQLDFILMHADGSVDTLHSTQLAVEVVPLVEDTTATEVRPLKALLGVPKRWHKLAVWAIAALVVLGLLIYAWRRYLAWREARLRADSAPLLPSKPAHLLALEELDRIKSLGLIEKGEIKLFHILVSEVVRKYIEARFGVEAPDMTTWELLFALEGRLPDGGGIRELIEGFLEACDLVKFAKYKPEIVEINSNFNQAHEIVERTRPRSLQLPGEGDTRPAAGPENESVGAASSHTAPGAAVEKP